MIHRSSPHSHAAGHKPPERKNVYSKVFRWRVPAGQAEEPAIVSVAGTFSDWKALPMVRDQIEHGWHLTLNQIPNNRTHHYMFLADGKPVKDEYCDGLAVPHGAEEEQFAITTPRGPRVFMLFAQTK